MSGILELLGILHHTRRPHDLPHHQTPDAHHDPFSHAQQICHESRSYTRIRIVQAPSAAAAKRRWINLPTCLISVTPCRAKPSADVSKPCPDRLRLLPPFSFVAPECPI